MKNELLIHFYQYNGTRNEFMKQFFIRFVRNRIIDPNTKIFLDRGFKFFNKKTNKVVQIPCDDSNWCEFCTFNEGFKLNVLNFPFTIKLHHANFYSVENYDEFNDIFKKMIEFRTTTIKLGWAVKYGLEYDNISYSLLEDLTENELINWVDPRNGSEKSLDTVTEEDFK